jgi:hypothetical protein
VECDANVLQMDGTAFFLFQPKMMHSKKTLQNCTVRIGTMQMYRLQEDSLDWGKIVQRERKFGMSTYLGGCFEPCFSGRCMNLEKIGLLMIVTKASSFKTVGKIISSNHERTYMAGLHCICILQWSSHAKLQLA